MINNFDKIEQFLEFEKGSFYKFELLLRNTDGNNDLYQEGYSKTNKNILIKSWYVDNADYLQKIKHEMITLANLTGARIYMTLDRKNNLSLVQELITKFTNVLCELAHGNEVSIKTISKILSSKTSVLETSDKKYRTLMFDVDTKDKNILNSVVKYIESKGQTSYVVDSRKGYHVFCYRKFDHSDWLDFITHSIGQNFVPTDKTNASVDYAVYLANAQDALKEQVAVQPNSLVLVYHPGKNNTRNMRVCKSTNQIEHYTSTHCVIITPRDYVIGVACSEEEHDIELGEGLFYKTVTDKAITYEIWSKYCKKHGVIAYSEQDI